MSSPLPQALESASLPRAATRRSSMSFTLTRGTGTAGSRFLGLVDGVLVLRELALEEEEDELELEEMSKKGLSQGAFITYM